METELISTLFNYGFPSAIATYVIVKMEKTMQTLNFSINDLITLIKAKI